MSQTAPTTAPGELSGHLPATPEEARNVDLVLWPDPRLRRKCAPVETFDEPATAVLAALAERMFEVMRESKGVGLAAPQVGVNVRLFVMSEDGTPDHDRVYVNPVLSDPDGEEEAEEGCLSLPKVNTPVLRSTTLRLRARDLDGNEIDETAEGFVTRVWQHEVDHLNGVLLLDKMPPTQKMAHKKVLRELESDFAKAHPELVAPKKKRRFGRRR